MLKPQDWHGRHPNCQTHDSGQTVLSAFQSVEDQLSSLRILSEELVQQQRAMLAAKHGGWAGSRLGETERMAKHPPDPGKEPMVPADNAGTPQPNPPAMPAGEIEPDDFIKMINDKMINDALAPSGG